jgi:L1 cell adhesion molecule like protein
MARSCVGIWSWKVKSVEIIANDRVNRTTPSYVAFTATGVLVGDAAKDQAAANPENTVFDAKQLIGRKFTDVDVQSELSGWPFKVVVDAYGEPVVEVEYERKRKVVTAVDISAMVLGKMRETAETYVGTGVKTAVLTVPAYFTEEQRNATKNAGRIAGLDVIDVITEPVAAAIAYGLDKKKETRILVFDLGAALDVTLLTIDDGVFAVRAKARDPRLGDEIDRSMVAYLANQFRLDTKKRIEGSALQRLRVEWERAKRTLSSSAITRVYIEIEALVDDVDFAVTLLRTHVDEIYGDGDFYPACIDLVERVLKDGPSRRSTPRRSWRTAPRSTPRPSPGTSNIEPADPTTTQDPTTTAESATAPVTPVADQASSRAQPIPLITIQVRNR